MPARKISDDTIDTITYDTPARTRSALAPSVSSTNAGGEQHLEADVQIEQVARQERVADARRQRQIRRQEDRDGLVLVAVADALTDGVDDDGEQHDRRDHQHHRGQPVDDQRDADRRIPATDLNGRRAVAVGQEEQQSRHDEDADQRDERDDALGPRPAAEHQRGRRGEHRDRTGSGARAVMMCGEMVTTVPDPGVVESVVVEVTLVQVFVAFEVFEVLQLFQGNGVSVLVECVAAELGSPVTGSSERSRSGASAGVRRRRTLVSSGSFSTASAW